MPSPIESPRHTPPKASLLLRQTPALTVSVNKIMFRVNLTVPLRLFRTKTNLFLGCFVFVRGFAASGDKEYKNQRTHLGSFADRKPRRCEFQSLSAKNFSICRSKRQKTIPLGVLSRAACKEKAEKAFKD